MKTWLDLTEGFPNRFDAEKMKAGRERFQNSDAWLTHYDYALSQGRRAILLTSKNDDVPGPESQYPPWDFLNYRRTLYVDQLTGYRSEGEHWLAQYFPPTTASEGVEFVSAHASRPFLWLMRRWRARAMQLFREHHEGSRARAIMHRIRGSGTVAMH